MRDRKTIEEDIRLVKNSIEHAQQVIKETATQTLNLQMFCVGIDAMVKVWSKELLDDLPPTPPPEPETSDGN